MRWYHFLHVRKKTCHWIGTSRKDEKEQRSIFLVEMRRKVQKENVLLDDHDNNNIDKKGKQKRKIMAVTGTS